jgi:plastocyanin
LALAGSLTACGGGGGQASLPQSASPLGAGAQGVGNTGTTGGRSTRATAWDVDAGGQQADQALQALDFFDENITIDAGDSVTWNTDPANAEPHTVTFLGPVTKPPAPGNPLNANPAGGSSYDGTVFTNSGFLAMGATYTLTFPKAGTYAYLCLLHQPVMTGIVTVQPAGTKYPHSRSFYLNEGRMALDQTLQNAKNSVALFPYANGGTHLAAGIAPGLAMGPPSNATVLRFIDSTTFAPTTSHTSVLTVALGSTLTWTNLTLNEPHTVTFVPQGQPVPGNPFSPPTGPPSGQTYDGTALVNSGVLAPGQSFSLTFTKRGVYTYRCLFHDASGMIDTVVVN